MLYKRNKRHFFRFLCMLMLLLVHLDSYGYDFIGSLQPVQQSLRFLFCQKPLSLLMNSK